MPLIFSRKSSQRPFLAFRRRGASILEYAFLAALIAGAGLGAVILLGERTAQISDTTGDILIGDAAPPGAPAGAPLQGLFPGTLVWVGEASFILSPDLPSDERTVGILNAGQGRSLPFGPVTIVGPGATNFQILSNDCPETLGAGESCSITIRAMAASNGVWSARLQGPGVPEHLPLSAAATGFAAVFAWSGGGPFVIDGTPDGGPVPRSVTHTFVLTNVGTLSGAPSAPAVDGEGWNLVSTDCGAEMAIGASCTALVSLTTATNGTFSGTLAGGGAEIPLEGTASGFAPVFSWSGGGTFSIDGSPSPLPLPRTDERAFILTNTGTLAGVPAPPEVDGAGYTLVSEDCGRILSIGESCTVTVSLAAWDNGTLTGTLRSGPSEIALAGTAFGFAPAWTWSGGGPFLISDPSTTPADVLQTFVLTNVGTRTGAPIMPETTGAGPGYAFSLVSTDCGPELAVGSSCLATVQARYTDNVTEANGVLTSGDAIQPLSGASSGFAPQLAWDVLPAEFSMDAFGGGVAAPGLPAPGPAHTATLRNVGTLPTGTITVVLAGPDANAFEIVSNDCGGQTLAPGATCNIQVRLAAGTLPGDYDLQLIASASPSVSSSPRRQRVHGPHLQVISSNMATLDHGSWTQQGPVREWRIRNIGNAPAVDLGSANYAPDGFNWTLYGPGGETVAHGGAPGGTLTLLPGQDVLLHVALMSGSQLGATGTTTRSATAVLSGFQVGSFTGTYIAAPALTWTEGEGPGLDVDANQTLHGNWLASAWRRLSLQNTGNVRLTLGAGIEPNDWANVDADGSHTCDVNLDPGQSCFRDIRFWFNQNMTVSRTFNACAGTVCAGPLSVSGTASNYSTDIVLTITGTVLNYNITQAAIAAGWQPGMNVRLDNYGFIGSASTGTASLIVQPFPGHVPEVRIRNFGRIQGRGGNGGQGGAGAGCGWGGNPNGHAGGPALLLQRPVIIENHSLIAGGGGGGAGGAGGGINGYWHAGGGSGGGGAGIQGGQGGPEQWACTSHNRYGRAGQPGTADSGGQPGRPGNQYQAWGAWGGGIASPGGNTSAASGGAAGPAVQGNSWATWAVMGDVRGARQ